MKLFAVSAVNRLRWDDKRLPIYRHLTKYRPERTQGFFDRIAGEFSKSMSGHEDKDAFRSLERSREG